ncbi:MAG: GatB/YqeY domain-containing protein [Bacteroidetes bacterium]|nr:MAG: GatB/YqeY domain-containing protein [Bacteroidota bacterium]
MSLKTKVEEEMKIAMKSQQKERLEALRAIKSLILLAETSEGSNGTMSEVAEVQLLAKAIKQRKESAEIFDKNNRTELRDKELLQVAVIESFLPAMMSEDEVRAKVQEFIAKVGATSAKDMGKVMGIASKELAGKADNKMVSIIVKSLLP